MNRRTIFVLITIVALVLGSLLSFTGQSAMAQDYAPIIAVFIESNSVTGFHWPPGAEITMQIDDPATSQDPDFSEIQYVQGDSAATSEVRFGPGEGNAFKLKTGDFVSLSGGGIFKETVIVYLELDGADMPGDRLWGRAVPGAVVEVKNFHNRDIVRWETADPSGNWEAKFGLPGDQPGEVVYNFTLGTRFMILQNDDDGDHTQLKDWEMPFPTMQVQLTQNAMSWRDWPSGYPVDILFDDPDTPANPDYTIFDVAPETPHPEAPNCGCLPLEGAYRLLPGHTVTMDNGFLQKTHTVEDFDITSLDYAADLICGTAGPGKEIQTEIYYGEASAWRFETAGADGSWCANFSVPGDDEQNTFDLLPVTEGPASISDEDGDSTELTFPHNLTAEPGGERIFGNNWLADLPVTLEIDDPETSEEVDYTASANPGAGPYVLTGVQFEFEGLFDLQPGHLVRLIQGEWLKELVVSDELAFSELNYLTDTVSGMAKPGAHIDSQANRTNRVTIADASGNWSLDFSVPGDHVIEDQITDLLPIDNVLLNESDADGDFTLIYGRINLPWIDAGKLYDDLAAIGFARGGSVTLTIDDPGTADSPDYETSQVIGDQTAPWNQLISYQEIELPDWVDLKTGSVVTMWDDEVSKQVVLSDQEITNVNLEDDSVAGFATPGTELRLLLLNGGVVVARRGAVALSDGSWGVSFAVPGPQDWEQDIADINSGSQISTSHFDEDGDRTRLDWPYNRPPVIVALQVPADPVPLNTSMSVTASFSDPDVGDTHSATWDWGDGASSAGLVDEGSVTVSGAHVYSQPGVYTLNLTVCDAPGECDTASYQYIVVYDPNGGFVTGGGWIDSPPGAYTPDPTLSGPAHFGFVAKYKQGAKEPVGNTQFQFQVANLNFHADSYAWLVIAGSKAMFKGSGTINGAGVYGFMISAIDGDLISNANPDCFRIKIWDIESGDLIYDNQIGAEEDADPVTQLAAGSIMIHKGK